MGEAIFEILFEVALKLPGFLILRWVRPKTDPDGCLVPLIGLLFWIVVGLIIYGLVVALVPGD